MADSTGITSWQTRFLKKGMGSPYGELALSLGGSRLEGCSRNVLEPTNHGSNICSVVCDELPLSALSNGTKLGRYENEIS